MSERFEKGRVCAYIDFSNGKYDGDFWVMSPREAVTKFKNDCNSIIDYCKSSGIVTVDISFQNNGRNRGIHTYDAAFYINDQYVGYAMLELIERR